MRVIGVGAGVLGTMHAWQAVEREEEARGASVRNFGLIWVGGRADGPELAAALRARELWEEIGTRVPGLGFRANGSLTVFTDPAEEQVARASAARSDAVVRGYELLDRDEVLKLNPALRGDAVRGALRCSRDAAVEPRTAQRALRAELLRSGRYTFLGGREVREVRGAGGVGGAGETGEVRGGAGAAAVRDDRGEWHEGDAVVLCTGAWLGGLVRELAPELPVRRVRLQMMQTEPLGEQLTTSVADADSFRYYPAYRGPALDAMAAAGWRGCGAGERATVARPGPPPVLRAIPLPATWLWQG